MRCQDLSQIGNVVLRCIVEAIEDDDGLEVVVDDRREHRIFESPHDDGLVNERVRLAAQSAERVAHLIPGRALAGSDDQHFEVGLALLAAAEAGGQDVRRVRIAVVVGRPGVGVVAIAV